jgi:hypothetical protein
MAALLRKLTPFLLFSVFAVSTGVQEIPIRKTFQVSGTINIDRDSTLEPKYMIEATPEPGA